jgi:putative transposase
VALAGGVPQRTDCRNGKYVHRLLTTVGEVLLEVPRTRGRASPGTQVVARRQRRIPELDAIIRQVFLRGMSTRQTSAMLAESCGKTLSAT